MGSEKRRHERSLLEQGWFYVAPRKRKDGPAKPTPPLSQIPDLNRFTYPPSPIINKKGWIKESDSAYVRLAKHGGRNDLLNMQQASDGDQRPRGCPKNEWFYCEDNRIEDLEMKKQQPSFVKHEPYVPFYMSDPVNKPGAGDRGQTSICVENEQGLDQPVCSTYEEHTETTLPCPLLARPRQCIDNHGVPRKLHQRMPDEWDCGEPSMSKLLSGGYGKDWHKKRLEWCESHPPQNE